MAPKAGKPVQRMKNGAGEDLSLRGRPMICAKRGKHLWNFEKRCFLHLIFTELALSDEDVPKLMHALFPDMMAADYNATVKPFRDIWTGRNRPDHSFQWWTFARPRPAVPGRRAANLTPYTQEELAEWARIRGIVHRMAEDNDIDIVLREGPSSRELLDPSGADTAPALLPLVPQFQPMPPPPPGPPAPSRSRAAGSTAKAAKRKCAVKQSAPRKKRKMQKASSVEADEEEGDDDRWEDDVDEELDDAEELNDIEELEDGEEQDEADQEDPNNDYQPKRNAVNTACRTSTRSTKPTKSSKPASKAVPAKKRQRVTVVKPVEADEQLEQETGGESSGEEDGGSLPLDELEDGEPHYYDAPISEGGYDLANMAGPRFRNAKIVRQRMPPTPPSALDMVHQGCLTTTELRDGTSVISAQIFERFNAISQRLMDVGDGDRTIYLHGGAALRIYFTAVHNSPAHFADTMICDTTQCTNPACQNIATPFTYTAMTSSGLPFVHSDDCLTNGEDELAFYPDHVNGPTTVDVAPAYIERAIVVFHNGFERFFAQALTCSEGHCRRCTMRQTTREEEQDNESGDEQELEEDEEDGQEDSSAEQGATEENSSSVEEGSEWAED